MHEWEEREKLGIKMERAQKFSSYEVKDREKFSSLTLGKNKVTRRHISYYMGMTFPQ
jgi:hypothetical protein